MEDMANIFVIDISVDDEYLVSGMENGELSLWKFETDLIVDPYDPPT